MLIGELHQEQLDSQLHIFTAITTADGVWGLDAQGVTLVCIGNVTYTLTGGVDYSIWVRSAGGMKATLVI